VAWVAATRASMRSTDTFSSRSTMAISRSTVIMRILSPSSVSAKREIAQAVAEVAEVAIGLVRHTDKARLTHFILTNRCHFALP
jgi:hypothetical protein